jgi:hypothetical protein
MRTDPLTIRLMPLAQSIIEETVPEDPKKRRRGELLRPRRLDEEYVVNCMFRSVELTSLCGQMVQATQYLSRYRTGLKSLGEPITRLDHITYHLEHHLIRTVSLMDRSLQLVNEVFDLGVPERECSFRTVADNKHVKSTPVRKKLQNLESLLKPYREHRNVVIHQEGFRDSALDRIGPYYILQKSTEPADEFLKHWF